ncbi:hypothetical protein YYE_01630 [Plasmodium vinckei vinckei]|nr:hypothetical protein YYE_01630 [Plasmodium vinckei vinckei]
MASGKLPIIVLPPSGSSVSLIKKNVNDKKLKRGNRKAYRKNCFEKFNLASTFYKVILAFGIIIVVFLDNDNIQSSSQFSGITNGRNLSEAAISDETSSPGLRGTGVAESDEHSDEKSDNESNESESNNTDLNDTKEEESEKAYASKSNADHDSQESNFYSSQSEHTDDAKLNETEKSDEKNEQYDEQGYNENKSQEPSYYPNTAFSEHLEHAINTIPNDSIIRSFLHNSLTVPSDDELDDPYREQTQDDVESNQFTQWIDYMKSIVQEMNKGNENKAVEKSYDSGATKDEKPADSEASNPEQTDDSESATHEQTDDNDSESATHEQTDDSETSKPEQDEYAGLHNKMNLEYKRFPKQKQTGLGPLQYSYNLDIIDDDELNSLFNDSKLHDGAKSKIPKSSQSNEKEEPWGTWDKSNDLYKNQANRNPMGFNSNSRGNENINIEMWDGGHSSSMNKSQGMNSWEYPSTRNQAMTKEQHSSMNRNQGMNSWEYPSTRNQAMNKEQHSSINKNQGMNSWEYPSTRNQGMNREQYPSMTVNEDLLGRKIIDELQNLNESAGGESMWSGLKKSHRHIPRKPADSSFSGLEGFSRERHPRGGDPMDDRVDILEEHPYTSTGPRYHNPMNRYNYMNAPSQGSQPKSAMNILRPNDPYRASAEKSNENEQFSSMNMALHKKTSKEQSGFENRVVPSQFTRNDGNRFNQPNRMNSQRTINDNHGIVSVRGDREVNEFKVEQKKSAEVQIKEIDDYIDSELNNLGMQASPSALFAIWSEFIAAETKKFMMIQEYILQYSIYLQRRNNLNPSSRTKAWWKVHYNMVNKFIKYEKEHVCELKELLKSRVRDTSYFIRFIIQKREVWRVLQAQIQEEWMASLTYKMNKYAAQDN